MRLTRAAACLGVALALAGLSVDVAHGQQPGAPGQQPGAPGQQPSPFDQQPSESRCPDGGVPQGESGVCPDAEPLSERAGGGGIEGDGHSPFCERNDLDAASEENCRRTKSMFRRWSLPHYGLDNHVEMDSVQDVTNLLSLVIQNVCAVVWAVLLLVLNGVLLVLEWAFALDLVAGAMGDVRDAIDHLTDNVLGQSWLLMGISIAGLWGIWNGLVRMKTTQTMGSLALTVVMMCAALVLMHNPQGTIGEASRIVNDASLTGLSVASSGSTSNPGAAFAKSHRGLFDALVVDPWCALQFGDVDYCYEEPGEICEKGGPGGIGTWLGRLPGDDGDDEWRPISGTIADEWLSHGSGSETRVRLVRCVVRGPNRSKLSFGAAMEIAENRDNPGQEARQEVTRWWEDRRHGRLMGSGTGAIQRLGGLALVAVGLVGAILLLLYLAVKLIMAAIFTLLLLLAAPVMLVVPAFGDGGRNAFVTWLKRLGSAIVTKLVFAIFLTMVVLIANVISGLESLGWYPRWMMLTVFFWGTLIKHDQVVSFLAPGQSFSGAGMLKAYLGYRMVKELGSDVARTAAAPAVAAGRGVRAGTDRMRLRSLAGRQAGSRDAERELDERASNDVRARKQQEQLAAQHTVDDVDEAKAGLKSLDDLDDVRQRLTQARRRRNGVRNDQKDAPSKSGRKVRLAREEDALDKDINKLRKERDALLQRTQGMDRQELELRASNPEYDRAKSVRRGSTTPTRSEIRDEITQYERQVDQPEDVRELILRRDGGRPSRTRQKELNEEVKSQPARAQRWRDDKRDIASSKKQERSDERVRRRVIRR